MMKAKPPKKYRWKVYEQNGAWISAKNPYCYSRFDTEKEAKEHALRMGWKDYVA